MTNQKKSFIAYKNWKSTFDELSDEDAGKLVKHIFDYVNGNQEKADSVLIRAVFANIKDSIDRDLQKWEIQLEQRRAAGIRSAEVRKSTSVERSLTSVDERERNSTDNVSVSVSDSVTVTESENEADVILWPSFEDFWDAYDKKVDRSKVENKWDKLSQAVKEKIMQHLELYIPATPDKQYRKNPTTYLNNKTWEDEEIINQNLKSNGQLDFNRLDPKQLAEYIKQRGF